MGFQFHKTETAPSISLSSLGKLTLERNRKLAQARWHVFVSNEELYKYFPVAGNTFPFSGRALAQRFLN